jgi:hypothetical protein
MLALAALVLMFGATSNPPLAATAGDPTLNQPPRGFRALFNGKDLARWKGQIAEDPRRVVKLLDGLSDAEKREKQAEADRKTFEHWVVRDGVIHYDGTRGIGNIETREEFGDFELYLDWKIGPKGDSGVFLRNMPQVQIWDPSHQKVGSGGLYNNKPRIDPLKTADRPTGQWNMFHIKMVGDRVWIKLNGETVIDNAVQDNYWAEFKKPAPPRGSIVLQSHGTPLWFRNVYIKELDGPKKATR